MSRQRMVIIWNLSQEKNKVYAYGICLSLEDKKDIPLGSKQIGGNAVEVFCNSGCNG